MTKRLSLIAAWTCLIFTCTVLLPPAAVAAPRGPRSLGAMDEGSPAPQRDGFWRRVGRFLKHDWQRTRADFKRIRARIGSWRAGLSGKRDRAEKVARLQEKLVEAMSGAMDEMGARSFLAAMERSAGIPVLPEGTDLEEHRLRGLLLRQFQKDFAVLGESLLDDRREVDEALDRAELMVTDIRKGDEASVVVERHLRPVVGRQQGRSRGRSFFKGALKILRTLFFCAALGALGMISMGVIAYGLTVEFFAFTAVGGGLAIACLVGIVRYVVQCIKSFRVHGAGATAPPVAAPLPAPDMMGGE